MPEQELNLLKLTATVMAQFRTCPPQVVRRNVLQARSLAAGSDHVPHDILRDAFPPHLSHPADGPKDPSLHDPGCRSPLIESGFHPVRNGRGPNVATFAN